MALPDFASNLILAQLPARDLKRIAPRLETAALAFGQVLLETGDPIRRVWFPLDSLVSLLTAVDRHRTLETAMVGADGLVGVPVALGATHSEVRAIVQGSGPAASLAAAHFRALLARSPAFRQAVLLYTQSLMTQVAQTAACNRFHDARERLARWLLMTADRLDRPDLALTQAFLANMLGLRRVGITQAAGQLKRLDLIDYARGHLRILDRRGLERAACCCYRRTQIASGRGRA